MWYIEAWDAVTHATINARAPKMKNLSGQNIIVVEDLFLRLEMLQ